MQVICVRRFGSVFPGGLIDQDPDTFRRAGIEEYVVLMGAKGSGFLLFLFFSCDCLI